MVSHPSRCVSSVHREGKQSLLYGHPSIQVCVQCSESRKTESSMWQLSIQVWSSVQTAGRQSPLCDQPSSQVPIVHRAGGQSLPSSRRMWARGPASQVCVQCAQSRGTESSMWPASQLRGHRARDRILHVSIHPSRCVSIVHRAGRQSPPCGQLSSHVCPMCTGKECVDPG